MPVYKNDKNGSWYVLTRYLDWKGERKQKCKRGFATQKEAIEWERTFQQQNAADLDMTFEAFFELYRNDMKPRLKENSWLTKENIVETKIMPYFGKRSLSEISNKDIMAWQNELLAYRDERHNIFDSAADAVHQSDPLHLVFCLQLLGHTFALGILFYQPREGFLAGFVHTAQVFTECSFELVACQQRVLTFLQISEFCSAEPSESVKLVLRQADIRQIVVSAKSVADAGLLVCNVFFQFHI